MYAHCDAAMQAAYGLIGKSVFEENCENIVEDIFASSKKGNCKLIFPTDVCVGKNLNEKCYLKNSNTPIIETDKSYYRPVEVESLLGDEKKARKELNSVLKEHKVDIVAIGNGTASREVFRFIRDWIKDENHQLETLVVNESGASVYSASKTAREEFPDLDLTVRGAVSIARRYQDPLAELVKIEPKSIGVGQYQHDVNQNRLKQSLERTVESCVNYVGVDLNRASFQLLEHVSGISPGLARNIVHHRNLNGVYSTRNDLLKVKGMGKRTFEQSAGFLRVMESENPLDQSAVHPENYTLVEQMAEHLELPLKEMVGNEEKLKLIDVKRYEEQGIGSFTLKDIIDELHKPGRDPRKDHETVQFDDTVSEIADLEKGMKLPGVITNVTHFGAFIDIGVHQDGLVHISRLSKKYIKDPLEVCTVGQKVDAWVLEVDE